ncbi:MAG: TetR/AcrR family transcriptional regulator [Chitinophagales bacterium]
MTNKIKEPWIEAGYGIFSKEGPKGLKVEVIARKVQKSKSSFYHHFADLEVFTELLLAHHLQRTKIMAEREALCKNVDPELIQVLLDFKQDLFFSRQLRVNRSVEIFKECLEKANQQVGSAFLGVWARDIGLQGKNGLASTVLDFTTENFYLQLTEENFNYGWLSNYFKEIKQMVGSIKR